MTAVPCYLTCHAPPLCEACRKEGKCLIAPAAPAQDVGEPPVDKSSNSQGTLVDKSQNSQGRRVSSNDLVIYPNCVHEYWLRAVAAELTRLRAALADALVDRNSYRERLSMERARADAMERDAAKLRAELKEIQPWVKP